MRKDCEHQMLDTIIQAIQSVMGPIGSLGRKLLSAFALICIISTGIASIKAFTSSDMKKGGLFLGISIIILIVSVIIYGAVKAIGKGTGQDINNTISMLPALAMLPTYIMYRMNKAQLQVASEE